MLNVFLETSALRAAGPQSAALQRLAQYARNGGCLAFSSQIALEEWRTSLLQKYAAELANALRAITDIKSWTTLGRSLCGNYDAALALLPTPEQFEADSRAAFREMIRQLHIEPI